MGLLSGCIKDKFEGTVTIIPSSNNKYLELVIKSDNKELDNIRIPKGAYLLEELLKDYYDKKNISVNEELTFHYFRPILFPFIKIQRKTDTDLTIIVEKKPKYKINIREYHTVPVKPQFSFQYL